MSQSENEATGIPMRVIHESYVEMLQAMGRYYQAEQQGGPNHRARAHSDLQRAVLQFFEVLRPYLRHKESAKPFWEGEPPGYDGDEGKAVLSQQSQRVPIDTRKLPDDWMDREVSWLHEQIKRVDSQLNGNSKIDDMYFDEDSGTLLLKVDQYQTGLKHLDGKYNTTRENISRGSSYMRGRSDTVEEKKRMPIEKLFAAAHAIEDAAESLDALAPLSDSVPRTKITEEMVEEIEETERRIKENEQG